ncbi:MBL fold metallo-hydrolase [Dactylosporangium darangshiense]|uniref:Uncharacterized protein n=1 Tax=Dactylosporangium darangshiense TaxID=579108 RepID=A0ABP8CXY3_9ACTN
MLEETQAAVARVALAAKDEELAQLALVNSRRRAERNPGVVSIAATAAQVRGLLEANHADLREAVELVVAGDVIYNGAHLYLSETSLAGLDNWRQAIDRVERLGARHIVAGHQNPKLDDDAARTIAGTREYLDVAEAALNTEKTAVDYFNAMVARYPDHLGRTVLWATAQAVFGIREHPGEDPIPFIAGGWL